MKIKITDDAGNVVEEREVAPGETVQFGAPVLPGTVVQHAATVIRFPVSAEIAKEELYRTRFVEHESGVVRVYELGTLPTRPKYLVGTLSQMVVVKGMSGHARPDLAAT